MADNWDPAAEERHLRTFAEVMKPHFEQLQTALPPGTQFGILVVAPGLEGGEGRVVVMTTDRKTIGLAAAQWITHSHPF